MPAVVATAFSFWWFYGEAENTRIQLPDTRSDAVRLELPSDINTPVGNPIDTHQ